MQEWSNTAHVCLCVFVDNPRRRLILHPEGSQDGALWYPRGPQAICCPKANTPADVSASPRSAPIEQEGGYCVRGMEELEDSFTLAGRTRLVVGLT